MSYYSGSATLFSDMKTVIENSCVLEGWTLSSGILSKNGVFFKLTSATKSLRIDGGTGQTGSTLTGASTLGTQILNADNNSMTFPVAYDLHIFSNPDEVYFIVKYNATFYQQISFGKSDVFGIGGSGAWITGTYTSQIASSDSSASQFPITVTSATCGTLSTVKCADGGLFFTVTTNQDATYAASYIHDGLDSVGWRGMSVQSSLSAGIAGVYGVSSMLTSLPNLFNYSSVLLPIKAIQYRSTNGYTVVANLNNARYLRNDYLGDGEIITLGAEKWKCYPFLQKNAASRDGNNALTIGHSGTFGYAIRYTGS